MLEQNSLLYRSQRMVLSELGVDVQQHNQVVPSLFRETPLESLQPWEYFDMLYCFSPLYRYLRPEKTLNSLSNRLGLSGEHALYQGLEEHKTAMQVTLFYALFVSWPDQLHATLPETPSHHQFMVRDVGFHHPGETSEHFSTALKQLFCEALAMYAQQALQRSVNHAENLRKI
jgi:hypothetical protein